VESVQQHQLTPLALPVSTRQLLLRVCCLFSYTHICWILCVEQPVSYILFIIVLIVYKFLLYKLLI
jgi:hypothetical protein